MANRWILCHIKKDLLLVVVDSFFDDNNFYDKKKKKKKKNSGVFSMQPTLFFQSWSFAVF